MKRHFVVTVNGQTFEVIVEEVKPDSTAVVSKGAEPAAGRATISPASEGSRPTTIEAEDVLVPAEIPSQQASFAGGALESGESPPARRKVSEGGKVVKAPMPGAIISVHVKEGEEVKRGQKLLVLEAMKMENDILAPQDGRIGEILVQPGQSVNTGDDLVVIEV